MATGDAPLHGRRGRAIRLIDLFDVNYRIKKKLGGANVFVFTYINVPKSFSIRYTSR